MPSPQRQRGMKMTLATAFKTLHQAFSTCFCIPARCFQAPGFKTISQSMGLRVTWCMLGSWPSQQRRGFFLLGWYVGSSGSMEGRLQPVSVLVQRGGGAGLSPPSPAGETQLHGNSFWEGEKRNKAKPSPPSCAQVPWVGLCTWRGSCWGSIFSLQEEFTTQARSHSYPALLAKLPGDNLQILST